MFINNATKEIMVKERVHRTRSTVLQSTGKVLVLSSVMQTSDMPSLSLCLSPPTPVSQDFSNIFSLLQSVKARDEGKGETVGSGKPQPAEEPRHQRSQAPPTHGYSRYDQEKFRGQEGDLCIAPPSDVTNAPDMYCVTLSLW